LHSPTRVFVLAVVVAAGFCLCINHSWRASPDAALYLALGESLAKGDGYVFDRELHTFVPPGFPVIAAAAVRAFGESFFVYRCLTGLLGLLTAVVAYALLMRLCGRDAALLVGGAFAVNHVLLDNSTLTLADVPFALFSMIALNCLASAGASVNDMGDSAARGGRFFDPVFWFWTVAAGLAAGLLPLIRINGLGSAAAGAFFLYCSSRGRVPAHRALQLVVFLGLAFLPAAIWQLWKASLPQSFSEGTYFGMIAGRKLSYQLGLMLTAAIEYVPETSYALTGVVLKTGVLELIPVLITLLGASVAWRLGDRLLVPLAAIQAGGLLLSPAGSRYLIFLLPGLYLFFALGLIRAVEWAVARFSLKLTPGRVLVVCFTALAALNMAHNFKTIANSRHALELNGPESEQSAPFFAAARLIRGDAAGKAVLTTNNRVIHYLSGAPTVALVRSGVPDQHAWVNDPKLIEKLIVEKMPAFVFIDSKMQDIHAAVDQALKALGMALREIPLGVSSTRYRFYAIIQAGGG
jgi:4-amino-4-deoxy-L-arabinose transferase-like glycosyltransferase